MVVCRPESISKNLFEQSCLYHNESLFKTLFVFRSQGVKIKMDDAGNILVRRYAKNNVYIKSTSSSPNDETAIGSDVLKLPGNCLEIEKVYKVGFENQSNVKHFFQFLCFYVLGFRHEEVSDQR